MRGTEILNHYATFEHDVNLFEKNYIVPLANEIAERLNLEKETSIKVEGGIYIVSPNYSDNNWIIAVPFYNKEVLDYYEEFLPPDRTEIVSQLIVN